MALFVGTVAPAWASSLPDTPSADVPPNTTFSICFWFSPSACTAFASAADEEELGAAAGSAADCFAAIGGSTLTPAGAAGCADCNVAAALLFAF